MGDVVVLALCNYFCKLWLRADFALELKFSPVNGDGDYGFLNYGGGDLIFYNCFVGRLLIIT